MAEDREIAGEDRPKVYLETSLSSRPRSSFRNPTDETPNMLDGETKSRRDRGLAEGRCSQTAAAV